MMNEKINYNAKYVIDRWASMEDYQNRVEYDPLIALELFRSSQHTQTLGNILLNEGINAMTTALASSPATAFSNANTYIGVGDSDTAAAATQTGLQAAANKSWAGMMETYPTYGSDQKITFKSQFATDEGNHDWNEITVGVSDDDSGVNLSRKVSDQGTKVSGQVWEVTYEITFS